ncbi:protein nutcracker [Zeugodacus cucurbitae]|uniref:protein nutcracker n=1 Tax=Zeugodacus cucurbitae TaxID=28588 RepID=UPI00059681DC|nr:protein nutcracker [Zeugodacus cucurbitae]XP_028896554.1 protein nutcracker [Zeugodacus cucurbitae]XP_028896560.1 protein nutcracker [Zeugodacus cucurbitae]XP_054085480.1 protein nutcracker [Zeugodacus cucurbitae]
MKGNEPNDAKKTLLEGLNELYKLFENKVLSQAHYLFLAVYVIALQTGFIPQSFFVNRLRGLLPLDSWSTSQTSNVKICCSQPPTYHHDSPHESYFTENFISAFNSKEEDKLKSQLIAIVTGDFMIVTLSPHSSARILGHSSCLSIGRYVIDQSQCKKTLDNCYQKLDQLQFQLRNELFVPIRMAQLSILGAFPLPTFMGIPRELRFEIYKYLNSKELLRLRRVSKDILLETKTFAMVK